MAGCIVSLQGFLILAILLGVSRAQTVSGISCDTVQPGTAKSHAQIPFRFGIWSQEYSKNKAIEVQLQTDSVAIKEFRINVFSYRADEGWRPAGRFVSDSPEIIVTSCVSEAEGSSLTNALGSQMPFWSVEGKWIPPADEPAGSYVVFFAAVRDSNGGNFTGIQSHNLPRAPADDQPTSIACEDVGSPSIELFPVPPIYRLVVSSVMYSPGQPLHVTITQVPSTGVHTFTKFHLAAFNNYYERVGKFQPLNDESVVVEKCSFTSNAVVQSDQKMKMNVTVLWYPPTDTPHMIQFVASVVDFADDVRHTGIVSHEIYVTYDNRTIQASNDLIECELATESHVNASGFVPYHVNLYDYQRKPLINFDWNMPVIVQLTSEPEFVFTNYLVRAFDDQGYTIGAFSSTRDTPDSISSETCGAELGDRSTISKHERASWMWIAPKSYAGKVRFIVAVRDFFRKSFYVIPSPWITGISPSPSGVNCSMATPSVETYPVSGSFRLYASKTEFAYRDVVEVTLLGYDSYSTYIVRAFDEHGDPSGSFALYALSPSPVKIYSCSSASADDGAVSENADLKKNATFTWKVPTPAPSSVMFVAAVMNGEGHRYTGIRSSYVNRTSNVSVLLPCPKLLPSEDKLSQDFLVVPRNMLGEEVVRYDRNEPVYVNIVSTKSSAFVSFRVTAFTAPYGSDTSASQPYGAFMVNPEQGGANVTACQRADDTAVAVGDYPRFNGSVMWVAPPYDNLAVQFVGQVVDMDGRIHTFLSAKLECHEPPRPEPLCSYVTPNATVFPAPSACAGVKVGTTAADGTFTEARSFWKNQSLEVHLHCPDDLQIESYMIRAFDQYGRSAGVFYGGTSASRKCTGDNDTAAGALYGDQRSRAFAFWRVNGTAPTSVRFYASYSDVKLYRVFTGLQSDWLYLNGSTSSDSGRTETSKPRESFDVSCVQLADLAGPVRQWLVVSDTKDVPRNTSIYELNRPLFVTLVVPQSLSTYALRIAAMNAKGQPIGKFQPLYRNPGRNADYVREERCAALGSTVVNNDSVVTDRPVDVMWMPSNQDSPVTFYAAIVIDAGQLLTNIQSEPVSPTLATVEPAFDCSEATPASEPFNEWRNYELNAWISGNEDGRKIVEVNLVSKSGDFNGYLIRAFDQNGQPVTQFLPMRHGSEVVDPYYCTQSADAFIAKRLTTPVKSARVLFSAPPHALGIIFVASVSHNGRLSTGIMSKYVNMSQTLLSQLGLSCNDVTPDAVTSPSRSPFSFNMQRITNYPMERKQIVSMSIVSGSSNQIKAYTIRAFDRWSKPVGQFVRNTSVLSTVLAWSVEYNATVMSCAMETDTLHNMQDWPRRYNMTFDWYAPVGAAEVMFIMTIIDTAGNVYRGVRSSWLDLDQVCAPSKCAQETTQRVLCNSTGPGIDPMFSDYFLTVYATDFAPDEGVHMAIQPYSDKNIRGYLLRTFTDEGQPVGEFLPIMPKALPTSCQTQFDAAWNITEDTNEVSINAYWQAPKKLDPSVIYIYFVAYVYDGMRWAYAKRSTRLYVRNRNGTGSGAGKGSWHSWCNITSLYTVKTDSQYIIRVPETFEDGQLISVELDSYMTREMYGFMVRAFDQSGHSVGKFAQSPYSAIQPVLHSCESANDAFTNKTSETFIYSRAAQWSNDGQNVKEVVFIATVYDTAGQLHTGIRSQTVYLKGEISTVEKDRLTCANTTALAMAPIDPKFTLDVNQTSFTVQQPLYVTIRTRGPRFSGFFVRAFSDQYQASGVFSHSYVYSTYQGKPIRCEAHNGDSITNSSTDLRYSQTVMWISPPTPPNVVIFVASVIDEHGRVTNAMRSKWVYLEGVEHSRTTPAPPQDLFCSETKFDAPTDPVYPPFIVEPANGTYVETTTSRHIQITSYGKTLIHWYFLRAYDREGKSVGTFDSYTWSHSYGAMVNYVYGELVECMNPADTIMSDLSASPRKSLVIRFTAPSRNTPDEVMFVAIVRDSLGVTYKAIQSKWITIDITKTAGTTTKASSVILVTFLSLLSHIIFQHRS